MTHCRIEPSAGDRAGRSSFNSLSLQCTPITVLFPTLALVIRRALCCATG